MSDASAGNATQPLVIVADGVTMTVAPELGARILGFSLDGKNILLEAQTVAGTENANNFGATFWPSPQSAWGWPPIAAIDHEPYRVVESGRRLVLKSCAGALSGGARIALTKTIAAVEGKSAIDVTYELDNVGDSGVNLAGWQIARVRSGGLTFFRLGEGGVAGDKLATVTLGGVQWYQYDADVVVAQGQKTFADAKGWLAHVDGDLILVQAFADVPAGGAAAGEAEVELYADPSHTYVEIEPQGPVRTLEPGTRSEPWTVRWWLRQLPAGLVAKLGNPELVAFVETLIGS
jgi:stage V sporulation protein SpoVS